MHRYFVYIAASDSGTLYVGVTSDVIRRMAEHKAHAVPGFTDRYNITKLVYVEETSDVHATIVREKQLKDWRRAKKVALIEGQNPGWVDLAVS
jgi:putative endonuclease